MAEHGGIRREIAMARAADTERYGARTLEMIRGLDAAGVRRMVVLMRHSAREYAPGRHDLENPLTARGRELAHDFGRGLPEGAYLRAYASPAERCLDTAELVHAAHLERGGRGRGQRPVEGLGVFYVLDQIKMYKAMTAAEEGSRSFVRAWQDGRVPADIMVPAPIAARLLLALLAEKLTQQEAPESLDLCVSHDLTLYLMREQLLGLRHEAAGAVEYLDGMAVYADGSDVRVVAPDAASRSVAERLQG